MYSARCVRDATFQSLGEQRDIEIDEQPNFKTAMVKLAAKLGLMERQDFIMRQNLDDDSVFHHKIKSCSAIQRRPLECQVKRSIAFEGQPAQAKLMCQTNPVTRLQ